MKFLIAFQWRVRDFVRPLSTLRLMQASAVVLLSQLTAFGDLSIGDVYIQIASEATVSRCDLGCPFLLRDVPVATTETGFITDGGYSYAQISSPPDQQPFSAQASTRTVGNIAQFFGPSGGNVNFVGGATISGFANSPYATLRGSGGVTAVARGENNDFDKIAYIVLAERTTDNAMVVYLNDEPLDFGGIGYAEGFLSGSPTLRVGYGASAANDGFTGESISEFSAGIVAAFFVVVPELNGASDFGAASGFPIDFIATIPGRTSDSPLSYLDNGADYGVDSTFVALLPVIGDSGTENPIFAANTQLMPSSSAVADGYRFAVPEDGPLFKAFSIPNTLPNGEAEFLLQFNGLEIGITSGQEVDFTAYFLNGISEFALLNVSPHGPLDFAPPSFAHGFRFTSEGIGIVSVEPIAIPEPMSGTLALLCIAASALREPRRNARASAGELAGGLESVSPSTWNAR